MPHIRWGKTPDPHDYTAAEAYLSLLVGRPEARRVTQDLLGAEVTDHRANDILRASGLGLLEPDDDHIAADLGRIAMRVPLSPILLVRPGVLGGRLVVADGYHRLCAAVHHDPTCLVPAKVAR